MQLINSIYISGDDQASAQQPCPVVRGVQQEQADIHHHRVHETWQPVVIPAQTQTKSLF